MNALLAISLLPNVIFLVAIIFLIIANNSISVRGQRRHLSEFKRPSYKRKGEK